MEHNISESGKRTSKVGEERSPGQMERCMREIISQARSTGKGCSNGQMEQYMMANSSIIILMDWAHISGQMAGSSMDSGESIKCMEREYSSGQTVADTRVTTLMTRRRGSVLLNGKLCKIHSFLAKGIKDIYEN